MKSCLATALTPNGLDNGESVAEALHPDALALHIRAEVKCSSRFAEQCQEALAFLRQLRGLCQI